jgi:uncharacterized protein
MDNRDCGRMAGELIYLARKQAGMTQTELAQAAGVTQSVVSAYETGRRQPTLPTLCRLLAAAGLEPSIDLRPPAPAMHRPLMDEVRAHLDEIREIVRRHEAERPRVFGSVARGEDHAESDLDLVVRATNRFSLVDQAAIARKVRELLGVDVDVVTEGALDDEEARRVDAEAVPL